ncbi:MAG: cell division protein FtsB [Gammaproteobacteria bacterium CG_4_10_14_0_8_um_filter_38_16]|nr:MAG: cell division protein FtsB [Gammaproteobacteria bacterium CG_4_10_14_0_8_um_filter_38_16]PJA04367.1 MAG: cell division protein FtsB [Gammaproteobacteria bacterium CG_4_10_14_0_2_um_filter_38_22]PJB09556.1 MAG: cell division protein FtsB [Gammaproteobacteria bacterium CG_4_9_14_3_um_filter_38_9]
MRFIFGALLLLLVLLQYEFWFSDGGMKTVWQMKKNIAQQQKVNAKLDQQNQLLIAQVNDLQNGDAAIEARARNDLGMVKKGEVFYQVVNK